MARVVSICNHKGGVGKTTVTANLGFALARNFKVLLVDLDPQANLSTGLKFPRNSNSVDVFMKQLLHFRSPVIETCFINEYVHLLPATHGLLEIEKIMSRTANGTQLLSQLLYPLRSNYDFILIDCPPAFNTLTINAITSCSNVLIPAKPELFSVLGIHYVASYLQAIDLPFKILFNQVNSRSTYHTQVIKNVKEKYAHELFETHIRNCISLSEAFESALDIFHYRKTSNGSIDFEQVANEFLEMSF